MAPIAIVVAGVAGSGKTTLGRALARSLGLPLLDLDQLTNPLLEHLPGSALGGHWLASPHHREIRDGRYAALRATAADVVRSGPGVVLVAPFTAELRGGPEWRALRESLAGTESPAGVEIRVVHLVGDAELFDQRRAARGEPRDLHRTPGPDAAAPAVPVVSVDAELTPPQQLLRALVGVGRRASIDPAAPLLARTFDAALFDLDGTLIDSLASVNRSWRRFATEAGVSVEALMENHGKPARVLVEAMLPADRAGAGMARITELELTDAVRVTAATGARDLYDAVPDGQRAVVTSGVTAIAAGRMRAAGIATPAVTISADDVHHGKPDPEPYLLAARRLGVDPARCLVFEDAPAGILSAQAAGCAVVAVSGTSPAEELTGAELVVDGLDRIALHKDGGVLRLALRP